jgi:hypothetical protein
VHSCAAKVDMARRINTLVSYIDQVCEHARVCLQLNCRLSIVDAHYVRHERDMSTQMHVKVCTDYMVMLA